MVAVEIDGPGGIRFIGCRFESESVGILGVGESDVTAQKCDFAVGDQPVFFDSDGGLVLEQNEWLPDGLDSRRVPFLAPTEWLISRIVERYFGR